MLNFFDNIHKIGMKSARMQDASYKLPGEIAKIRNPPLQGEGVKIMIPSNKIDIYTRL